MIKLIRRGLDVRYYSDDPAEIRRMENSIKYYVSGCEYSPSYRSGQWDGYYRFFEHKRRLFKYGMLHVVIEALEKKGIQYIIEDDFKKLKIKPGLTIDPNLWQHQKEGIIRFLLHPYGAEQVPTRAGKTKMAAELVRLTDLETVLFVVDTQLLFDQAIKDFSDHLKISKNKIGRIKGDTFELKPITVAMIQTLQSIRYGNKRLNKKKDEKPIPPEKLKEQRKINRMRLRSLQAYMQQVRLLIVDEVHEYSSDERIEIARMCENVVGGLFLSATLEKSSSVINTMKIKSLTGPTLYKVPPKVLKERGVLAQETIMLIMMDHSKNKNVVMDEEDDYEAYREQLIVKNESRNNIALNLLQILRHLEMKTLILLQYVSHAKYFHKFIGDSIVTGETPFEERKVTIKKFLKRKGGIMIATNILNKGITLPEVEVLVNWAGGKEQSLIIQKKGRALGVTESKKKALVIDCIDMSDYFSEHSLSRLQAYEREVGLDSIIAFDSSSAEFWDDIAEYITNFKNDEL